MNVGRFGHITRPSSGFCRVINMDFRNKIFLLRRLAIIDLATCVKFGQYIKYFHWPLLDFFRFS